MTDTPELKIIKALVDIKSASDGQKPLFACQGQAMDGFTELAHYRDLAEKAMRFLMTPLAPARSTPTQENR